MRMVYILILRLGALCEVCRYDHTRKKKRSRCVCAQTPRCDCIQRGCDRIMSTDPKHTFYTYWTTPWLGKSSGLEKLDYILSQTSDWIRSGGFRRLDEGISTLKKLNTRLKHSQDAFRTSTFSTEDSSNRLVDRLEKLEKLVRTQNNRNPVVKEDKGTDAQKRTIRPPNVPGITLGGVRRRNMLQLFGSGPFVSDSALEDSKGESVFSTESDRTEGDNESPAGPASNEASILSDTDTKPSAFWNTISSKQVDCFLKHILSFTGTMDLFPRKKKGVLASAVSSYVRFKAESILRRWCTRDISRLTFTEIIDFVETLQEEKIVSIPFAVTTSVLLKTISKTVIQVRSHCDEKAPYPHLQDLAENEHAGDCLFAFEMTKCVVDRSYKNLSTLDIPDEKTSEMRNSIMKCKDWTSLIHAIHESIPLIQSHLVKSKENTGSVFETLFEIVWNTFFPREEKPVRVSSLASPSFDIARVVQSLSGFADSDILSPRTSVRPPEVPRASPDTSDTPTGYMVVDPSDSD